NGKRVLIPKAVAEQSLSSLLGMGVDYTPSFAGHDAQRKIGIITVATIEGDAIHIEGFLYGADFPAVVKDIQSRKSQLGFSYEAQAAVKDWKQDPVEITSCMFTGAAILLKDKAAYTTTSLSANADLQELTQMDIKELLAAMAELKAQNDAMKAQNDAMAEKIGKMEASNTALAASSVLHKVKPHADRLRAAADEMEKDGLGMHEKRGHVAHLRGMADRMEADAILGKMPHIFEDGSWMSAAAADVKNPELDALKIKIGELEAKLFAQAAEPARKTLEASGAEKHQDDKAENLKRDTELKAAGATTRQRLAAILESKMK
ncbi:MAG: hypothetical protein ACYC0M_15655, partial [Burkholderiales bacterium]